MSSNLRSLNRRTAAAIVAIALATAAGASAYVYLREIQQRADHNAAMTSVYVVTSPIARGTAGSQVIGQNLIKIGKIPEQFRPEDAVTNLASVRGETANANLTPGEVLASGFFSAPTVTGAVAAIPKGDVAITVSVDPVHGVAGLIQAGDQVDILAGISNASEQFLYQNVQVLAVGTSITAPGASTTAVDPPSPSQAASNSNLITFAVPPAAAARIALAASDGANVTGSLYLALVPPGNRVVSVGSIDAKNLISATLSPS